MARRQAPTVDFEHGTRVAINWDEVPENSMNILAQALLDDLRVNNKTVRDVSAE